MRCLRIREVAVKYVERALPEERGVFHIDHDHKSGKVRGLLCSCCNTGIGFLKDDPRIMRKAADYVERHASSMCVVKENINA
jgi:hypothetical protein